MAVDFNSEAGRSLIHRIVKRFDVVCENLGPGRADRMGLGYDVLSEINPSLVYLGLSGFGRIGISPFANRPAMAGIAEAMAGIYEFARAPGQAPMAGLAGPLGDTSTGAFAAMGILAALQHRHRIGLGQFVDLSMYDSMLSLCDFLPNFWSLGMRKESEKQLRSPGLIATCKVRDGWFTLYVLRRHQFERLCSLLKKPEWLSDDRLATPWDWAARTDDILCPAIEQWASNKTKHQASTAICEAGIPAGPCQSAEEIVHDPHVAARGMLIEVPRDDGEDQPILVVNSPLKMSRVSEGPETKQPLLGEHTHEILREMLGISSDEIEKLKENAVIE